MNLQQKLTRLALVHIFELLQQPLSLTLSLSNMSAGIAYSTTKVSEGDEAEDVDVATFDFKKGVKNLVDTVPKLNKLPSQFILPLERNPLFVNYAHIPIIDISVLYGASQTRVSTVEAIGSACRDWGIFTIINHGIKEALVKEMMEVAEEFFGLNLSEKMKYASDDVMSPVRYGTSLNTSKKHNLHWRDFFRHYGHPFQDTFHLWPLNPPNYRNVARVYLEQLWEMAMKIFEAISEGLGLEKRYIEESLGEGVQILAANYYPPCPEPDKTLGLAAHSDHGALTILTQNGVDGLQIKHDQTWLAVQHLPGSFLVNIGDYLEILSNGRYKSVEHRATVNAQRTRISIAVGHGPPLSSFIGPASPLVTEKDSAQYGPIKYKDYIRLQQSSTARGKTALLAIKPNKI
ncbi:flavanone 3-dioxygenase 2-like [Salvia miltiorrhiza]|uniref:flavanone 3-dioxygenase 2-like n=1 Tax=Salvia miltiorrhiza TaxID=226208 RepID=UPI0025ACAEEC|nr:flavanone 3-dioxygenase 2-like [Salvia miltiorrhiza]